MPHSHCHLSLSTMLLISIATALAGSTAQMSSAQAGAIATVQTFVRANETANLDLIVSTFDEDATVFLPNGVNLPPARISGKTQLRSAFEALFKSRTGPIMITARDLMAQVFGDIAIITLHLRDLPTAPVQAPIPFPRRTFVLRRSGDRWLIVHLHASSIEIAPSSK